jgi:ribosomal protein S17E
MNLVKTLDQYHENNIYFCAPIKNNVMNEGNFIRIIYSTPNFSLNSINLIIPLAGCLFEKYYSKYKCSFDYQHNKHIINKIKIVEENILKHTNIQNKIPQYKIFDQLKNGNVKIFSVNCDKPIENKNTSILLKISGIWENEMQYGLTYKFLQILN